MSKGLRAPRTTQERHLARPTLTGLTTCCFPKNIMAFMAFFGEPEPNMKRQLSPSHSTLSLVVRSFEGTATFQLRRDCEVSERVSEWEAGKEEGMAGCEPAACRLLRPAARSLSSPSSIRNNVAPLRCIRTITKCAEGVLHQRRELPRKNVTTTSNQLTTVATCASRQTR